MICSRVVCWLPDLVFNLVCIWVLLALEEVIVQGTLWICPVLCSQGIIVVVQCSVLQLAGPMNIEVENTVWPSLSPLFEPCQLPLIQLA